MMIKNDIIINMTRACNYNCSYCNVIKDRSRQSAESIEDIIRFLNSNYEYIGTVKFFGGEPTLVFCDIKNIIDSTVDKIGNNFVIVTNTTILTDDIGEYFSKYFANIFFSIDSENIFKYEEILSFIDKFSLKEKLYINLVINPGEEKISGEEFDILREKGIRKFKILPVYHTKEWSKENLLSLSDTIKIILSYNLDFYGFRQNDGLVSSLINESFFIDTDSKVYYSDIVSTIIGNSYKPQLFIGELDNLKLGDYAGTAFSNHKKIIETLENYIYNKIKGQKELHKIMDYFSVYLNKQD